MAKGPCDKEFRVGFFALGVTVVLPFLWSQRILQNAENGWKAPPVNSQNRSLAQKGACPVESVHTCVQANPGSALSLWEEVGERRGGLALLKAKKAELQEPTC